MERTYFVLVSYGKLVREQFPTAKEAYHYAINMQLNRYETEVVEWYGTGSDDDDIVGRCSLDECLEYNYETLDF